jgi:hypothetical protein
VKNVCADQSDIEAMYRRGIDAMKRTRENRAGCALSNEFMERVLPELKA